MPTRPLIGVTTQTLQAIDGIPEGLPHSVVMNQRYYHAIAAAGAAPVLIPLLDDVETLRAIYERIDGVLVPGGVDIDPAQFGEEPHARLGRIDPARDGVEIQLVKWAASDGKPVLGLCRGLQVINVALGGTLYQDLEAEFPNAIKHDYYPTFGFARDHIAHDVTLAHGSRLRHALESDRIPVNSMHHQGIKALATPLAPTATAPDGLIEAAEAANESFMVGVQWHPEVFETGDPNTAPLFREFVDAAGRSRPRRMVRA
ncbi:MAG TPA: gamma-glutamyl-gamma-aminobutyrate hydrolase family protein [Gemmatimonadaceae bacterium]|jgi:putative glutamine amidotransferase|nr:gamma-glutamyl-gamma-aminobutyrate hydrolase family protein [Gemmatimonadaceae bacterium]